MQFFFDIKHGDIDRHDTEGHDLPDVEAARREAMTTAGEMIRSSAMRDPVQHLTITVRTSDRVVVRCTFDVVEPH